MSCIEEGLAVCLTLVPYHGTIRGKMPRQISEERKRNELIDPQLEKAGWDLRDGLLAKLMRSEVRVK